MSDTIILSAIKQFKGGSDDRRNLPPVKLIEEAVKQGEAILSDQGSLVAKTGQFTGRSPMDKFVVQRETIRDYIDWNANKPLSAAAFENLFNKAMKHCETRNLYTQDLLIGSDPASQVKVRVYTEQAWHNLFATNMFIRSAPFSSDPDWTVLQLPSLEADPQNDKTRSSTAIAIDFESKLVLIVGTAYAGEIKKAMFTVQNYLLPEKGIMPMHCSANIGGDGNVALFFGLSGTGKTTLSTDASRSLIGDDEHGWGKSGVFNFEGGCYAKVIDLDPKAEPEIFAASNRFGTILENVVLNENREVSWGDRSLTENTRSSYPLGFVENAFDGTIAGHPNHLFMLTADAFGVLPPISHLSRRQAMYHFLSGYTAKIAGTERGVTEPVATFSTCFGAPFMPRRPMEYAQLLGRLLEQHKTKCWLINTGWSGGSYGTGSRMPIKATRAMLNAALNNVLDQFDFKPDPSFSLMVPVSCPGVDKKLLQPRENWADKAAYDETASRLCQLFEENFAKHHSEAGEEINQGKMCAKVA